MAEAKRTDPRIGVAGGNKDRGKNPVRGVRIEAALWDAVKSKADAAGTTRNAVIVDLLMRYLDIDPTTLADITEARRHFATHVTRPKDPSSARGRDKSGMVEAIHKASGQRAGSVSFAVDEDHDLPVQTVQFTTEPDFLKQHVALLLAYDLREHYGVRCLRSSPMEPTAEGRPLLASLRRRGITATSPIDARDQD